MIKNLFKYFEESSVTFYGFIFGLFGITYIRGFIENFFERNKVDVFSTDLQTMVHYELFYFFTIGILILIVQFFSKKNIVLVSKVFLFSSILVWSPPIIDGIVSQGKGFSLAYLFDTSNPLWIHFLDFIIFGSPGVSVGVRIEFVILFIAVFFYVHSSTKNLSKSLLAVFSAYCALFTIYAIPVLIGINFSSEWISSFKNSLLWNNYFHPEMTFVTTKRTLEMFFNVLMSQFFYIGITFMFFGSLYLWNTKKFIAVLGNSRPERVVYYFLMILGGITFAASSQKVSIPLSHWYDYSVFLILFLSFYFVWMFSVALNDINDYAADKISNPKRPLALGSITEDDMRIFGFIFGGFALIGGYLVSHYVLYMIIVFMVLAYIYSLPPLFLKRFLIINSFIMALGALTAFLAGFYLVSNNPHVDAVSPSVIFLIIVVYMLFTNVKDIKDKDGDLFAGVNTIPTLFGLENGKKIIAILSCVALFLIPLLSGLTVLWRLFLPFSFLAYHFITKEVFEERKVFYVYFSYVFIAVLLIFVF